MPRSIDDLEFRIIPKAETAKEKLTGKAKAITVRRFAQKFINPETEKLIEVGEAVEVGPFETIQEGDNWLRYYLPDAYKDPALNWPLEKKGRSTRTPVTKVPKEREGKFYIWVMRVY